MGKVITTSAGMYYLPQCMSLFTLWTLVAECAWIAARASITAIRVGGRHG